MRRLALLALVVPLAAGCGWPGIFLAPPHVPTPVTGHWSTYPAPAIADVAHWRRVERLPVQAMPGATLFATTGCLACHTYAGAGTRNLHAPDLTAVGAHRLGIRLEVEHLRCPSCVTPGSPMPQFSALGAKRLRELAIFLEASKGTR